MHADPTQLNLMIHHRPRRLACGSVSRHASRPLGNQPAPTQPRFTPTPRDGHRPQTGSGEQSSGEAVGVGSATAHPPIHPCFYTPTDPWALGLLDSRRRRRRRRRIF
jgi:hypothetical protein